jgi:hypothetical protein
MLCDGKHEAARLDKLAPKHLQQRIRTMREDGSGISDIREEQAFVPRDRHVRGTLLADGRLQGPHGLIM